MNSWSNHSKQTVGKLKCYCFAERGCLEAEAEVSVFWNSVAACLFFLAEVVAKVEVELLVLFDSSESLVYGGTCSRIGTPNFLSSSGVRRTT